ncbi:CDP-alcohol phosphatidyltransferase family protein [Nocardia sp. CA-119907]|uniref:CDP-alcohol phosphatidyltransferase family protein n=1 Tax=Nocardia sp. CA-119907 TaxID=3239973 RepID=UPI003D973E23
MSSNVEKVRGRLLPWAGGRLFRSGIPLDQPVVVTDRVLTAANGITIFRLLALPVCVYLVVAHEQWVAAFGLLGFLVFLDTMDGYVARRFNQATKLGTYLDPVVDRITVLTVGAMLVVVHIIPAWLALLVVLRDALLVVLGLTLKRLGRPRPGIQVPITRISKLATILLLTGLAFLLLSRADLSVHTTVYYGALLMLWIGIVLYYIALGQYFKAGMTDQSGSSE